jgi:serine/threonine-protein kinase HipA
VKLSVWYEKQLVGELTENFEFSYSKGWRDSDIGFDIAFSLPRHGSFSKDAVLSFFSNMLIEGDLRAYLAKQAQIDVNDHFTFLKEFGQDCAGALVMGGDISQVPSTRGEKISWSSLDRKIDQKKPLVTVEEGHFSLAGAQDKMAVIVEENELRLPTFSEPSTHILKPISSWEGVRESVFNEWFCMRLAKEAGLDVPAVTIHHSKHAYYVVERYDRKMGRRLHQQDVCQALGIMASKKYENRGGPKLVTVYSLIQQQSQNKFKDLKKFLRWMLFNTLIGNYDSHAKNVSFLLSDGKWSLAPAYDLMSTAVYEGFTKDFAFSIGGQFRSTEWRKRHFEILEEELGLKKGALFEMLEELIVEVILSLPQVEYEGNEIFSGSYIHGKIIHHIQKMVAVFDQKVLR